MSDGKSPLVAYALSECAQHIQHCTPQTAAEVEKIFTDLITKKITLEQSIARLQPIAGPSTLPQQIVQILSIDSCPIPFNDVIIEQPKASSKKKMPHLWMKNEDMRLLAAIHRYGLAKWGPVSKFVGNGRTRSQCSQRWYRSLDPKMKKNKWSVDEDEALLKAVALHGDTAWTKIAKDVGTRCDIQCRYRYLQIMKSKVSCTLAAKLDLNSSPIAQEPQIDTADNGGKSSIFQYPETLGFDLGLFGAGAAELGQFMGFNNSDLLGELPADY